MRTSSKPNRSSGLRIGGWPTEESESRRADGGFGNLAAVVDRAPLEGHLSPPGKGKGKISEIKYPSGSKYLRAAMKYKDAMGPSRVTPQKYPRIFIIILLYILGMNWAKLGFFRENDDLTNYEIANLVNPEI